MNEIEQKVVDDIREGAKHSWADNYGFNWSTLKDETKLAILSLREKHIINIDAIQGMYVFCSEVLQNE